jgi:hypothetical protein
MPSGTRAWVAAKAYVRERPGGGERRVRERLRALFDHGLLDRVDEPVVDYDTPGSDPMIYALGNEGAAVLAKAYGLRIGTIDWRAKNQELISKPYIYHTLAVAEVMVALAAGCRERGNVRLLAPQEVVRDTPHASAQRTNPYLWRVSLPDPGLRAPIGMRPDKICGLHVLARPEGRNRAYFCLEADLGTMPVERETLRQTSIAKKIIGYSETYKQKLHTALYNWGLFRVLFVTTSQERVDSMLQYVAKVTHERRYRSDLFVFADYAALAQQHIFDVRWRCIRNGAEEGMTLLGA